MQEWGSPDLVEFGRIRSNSVEFGGLGVIPGGSRIPRRTCKNGGPKETTLGVPGAGGSQIDEFVESDHFWGARGWGVPSGVKIPRRTCKNGGSQIRWNSVEFGVSEGPESKIGSKVPVEHARMMSPDLVESGHFQTPRGVARRAFIGVSRPSARRWHVGKIVPSR